MTRVRGRRRKHFVCRFCDSEEKPVVGKPRVGRRLMICPVCRGPAV